MPKKATYSELVESVDRLNKNLHTAERMVAYLAGGVKPDAVERFKETEGAGRYTYSLYGAKDAHGGVLLKKFAYPNQRDSFSVEYLDDYITRMSHEVAYASMIPFKTAALNLNAARQALLEKEVEK